MKKNLLFLILITSLISPEIFGQQKNFIISGFIKDAVSGEFLVGANILLYKDTIDVKLPPLTGCSTNRFGYFIIPSLNPGNYFLVARFIGYRTFVTEIYLSNKKPIENLSVELTPEDIQLEEVIVKGEKKEKTLSSTIDISPELLSKLPTLSGEMDLFKSLELLPGVNKASEISSGLYIRGGSPDQTLTLVDGVIVYNPAHLGNIASTFNSNAISDIRLIKGAFPAEYGGRLSSILDIKLRSGSKEKEKGSLGIGLINSFASFEGPFSENSTYMLSGRTMYYDVLQKKFDEKSSVPRYNFFDVNAKITYELSEKSILSISGLYSSDHAYSTSGNSGTGYDIKWKNVNLSLNWLQINNKSLLLNSIASFINYEFSSKIGLDPTTISSYSYFSNPNLVDFYFRENAEYKWHQDHTLKTGFDFAIHNYDLLFSDAYNEALEKDPYAGKNLTGGEFSIYFQNESDFSEQLKTNLGVRFYYFHNQKLFSPEPRISVAYHLNEDLILKGAFAIAHQFLHLIVRNDITLPTDLWYPSTEKIKPASSTQYVLGFDSYWLDQSYSLTVEGFYKRLKNIYEFRNTPVLNPFDDTIEDQFVKGQGESYGIEFFINKRKGKFSGWIGYTLSASVRQFDQLNSGKKYYSKYDRRHDISFVLSYQLYENLSFGLTWIYAIGQRYSLPPGQFIFDPIGTGGGEEIQYNYVELNSQKFPDYHKLDLNASYSFIWFETSFEAYINLYNVYNRHNAFAQYVVKQENENGEKVSLLKRITLFPFIPSIGISVKF